MKRFLKSFCSFGLVLLLILSLSITSYADVNDLLIGTGSNALMTMELDDEDYGISTFSSLGSVANTVDLSQVFFTFWVVNPSTGKGINIVKSGSVENNKISVKLLDSDILDGYYLSNMGMHLKSSGRDALPPSGTYKFSFDLSNQFSYSFDGAFINMEKLIENAQAVSGYKDITQYTQFSSGEAYCPGVVIDLRNVSGFYVNLRVEDYAAQKVRNLDGLASFRFELSSASPDVTVGIEQSAQDYQNDVSGSLSDLSSSVDDLDDSIGEVEAGIDEVTNAIQNLQGAMEPHYANVLTQLHHITEQLHALWDQQFNLHHVPLMAKLDEIKSAIANMDLEVVVELDELKQTVNNMSQAIQNKLQSVQDGINNKLQSVQDTLTGGYNTGGIDSDQGKLEDSLTEYEEAEKNVIDKVNDSLNDFEFDSGFEEYTNTISTISDFLQALYDSSGGFKVVINLSLMLSLASLVIGFYRFKG